MYVRWKRRARARDWHGEPTQLLSAALIESQRIDGKPRQRIVAYLGSIKDTQLRYPLSREDFWHKVTRRIDTLGLPDAEQVRIAATLAEVVPRPSPAEVAEAEEARTHFRETLRQVAQLGGRRRSRA